MDLHNESLAVQAAPEIQNFQSWYADSWIVRAVECLVTARDFNPSPKVIAQRLNITVEQAVESLDALEKIGNIIKTNHTYVKAENITILGERNATASELLKSHSKLAPQIMSQLTEESIFTTQISLGTLEIARKHSHRVIEFLNAIDSEASTLQNPDVLAIEISIAKISADTRGA